MTINTLKNNKVFKILTNIFVLIFIPFHDLDVVF